MVDPPDSRDRVLVVRGVTQRFGDRLALDAVDLSVPAGQVVGLLGPNGAGKTTLMRAIFGVIEPDRGTITWRGRPASAADRRMWGYLPQERGLYRDMRVEDHLVWLGRLHGLDARTSHERTGQLLARLGLADRRRDAIKDLSGGLAQRVQLAAAIVHDPAVLVLDEPFAGLDPSAVEFLSGVVLEHVAGGRNVVLSSHQLDLVEDVCETIYLLHEGRVVLHGRLSDLKAASAERYLRVDVAISADWLSPVPAAVERSTSAGSRIRLRPGTDAGAVLDLVRAHADVNDFAVEAPSLSELFLHATGTDAAEVDQRFSAQTTGAGVAAS
jgi:ABC-2 type transport system ATP-binding protein